MSEQNGNTSENEKINNQGTEENFDLSTELKKYQEQAEKYKSEYLYLRAEFDNYRKHVIKERSDLLKYGSENFSRDLLGVLDNFERALQTQVTSENFEVFCKGIALTAQELKSLLGRYGVTEMPAEGAPFDPNVHEALASEPSSTAPEGHVLRVFQKAYKIHDKLLRPAQVVVAKKPE